MWRDLFIVAVALILIAVGFAYAQVPVETPSQTGGGGVATDGKATVDIDLFGYKLYDSTQAADLGTACTTSHSLVTGDVCIGGSGELEVDGVLWADGGLTCGDDIAMGDNSITGIRAIHGGHETTDVSPDPVSISGKNSWAQATGSNNDGSVLSLVGGLAANYVTINNFDADASTDTIALRWYSFAGATTHTLTEGTDFDCITSVDTCVTNLTAAIEGTSDTATSTQGLLECFFGATADLVNDRVEVYSYGPCYIDLITCGDEGGGAGPMCTKTGNTPYVGDVWIGASSIWLNDDNTGIDTNGSNIVFDVAGSSELTIASTLITMEDPLNMVGNYIYSSSNELDFGAACSSGHAVGTTGTCTQGPAEFNSVIWADAGLIGTTITATTAFTAQDDKNIAMGSAGGGDFIMQFNASTETNDLMRMLFNTTYKVLMLMDVSDQAVDHNVGATTDPILRIQSNDGTQVNDYIAFQHDQTDARIDVGNGELRIDAEHTMHAHGYIDAGSQTVGLAAAGQNVWVEVDGCTSGTLRGFTHSACDFTAGASSAGVYSVHYAVSFSGSASKTVEGGISIGDSIQAGCRWTRGLTGTSVGSAGAHCILTIAASGVVKPEIRGTDATPADVTVTDISVMMTKL